MDTSRAADSLRWGSYADDFLANFLGAREIRSVDYSSAEGADIVHDIERADRSVASTSGWTR